VGRFLLLPFVLASGCGLLLDYDPAPAGSDGGVPRRDSGMSDGPVDADAPVCAANEDCFNGIDDDCDMAIDDADQDCDCTRWVSYGASGDGRSLGAPSGSIDEAVRSLDGAPGRVCVSGCGADPSYDEVVTMGSFATVAGGYTPESFAPDATCQPVVRPGSPGTVLVTPEGVTGAIVERLTFENTPDASDVLVVEVSGSFTMIASKVLARSDRAAEGVHVSATGIASLFDVEVDVASSFVASGDTEPMAVAVKVAGGTATVMAGTFRAAADSADAIVIFIGPGIASITRTTLIEAVSASARAVAISCHSGCGLTLSNNGVIHAAGASASGLSVADADAAAMDNDEISAAALFPGGSGLGAGVRSSTGRSGASLVLARNGLISAAAGAPPSIPALEVAGVAAVGATLEMGSNARVVGATGGVTTSAWGVTCYDSDCTVRGTGSIHAVEESTDASAVLVDATGVQCASSACVIEGNGMTEGVFGAIEGTLAALATNQGVVVFGGTARVDANRIVPGSPLDPLAIGLLVDASLDPATDVVATNDLFEVGAGSAIAAFGVSTHPVVIHSSTIVRADPVPGPLVWVGEDARIVLRNDLFSCDVAAPILGGVTMNATIRASWSWRCVPAGPTAFSALMSDPFAASPPGLFHIEATNADLARAGSADGMGRELAPPTDYFGTPRDATAPSVGYHEP
jgi:hypothetical protein